MASTKGVADPADRYEGMTTQTKAKCLALADLMDELKREPGGTAFQTDLMLAVVSKAGLTIVDKALHDGALASLREVVRICDAVRYTTGLGKGQLERVERAKAVLATSEGR